MAYNHHKKFSKSNSKKKPFSEINPHSFEAPIMRTKNIIITSIDPGIVNCGVYTCVYDSETKKHKSIYLEKHVFNKGNNHYIESINILEAIEEKSKLFSSSHYIVIESQMTVNYDLVRMGQHLISFFMTILKNKGNRPLIIEISNQTKTKLLDCPKGISKYQYKKWCVNKALDLLKERDNDEVEKDYIFKIENSSKSDDMGDCVCQYYGFINYLEGEYNRPTLPVKRY